MNQVIQFIDRTEYAAGVLTFYAQVNGLLVPCILVTGEREEQKAKAHFEKHRFDYEDAAERLIEEEAYNSRGEIEISLLP